MTTDQPRAGTEPAALPAQATGVAGSVGGSAPAETAAAPGPGGRATAGETAGTPTAGAARDEKRRWWGRRKSSGAQAEPASEAPAAAEPAETARKVGPSGEGKAAAPAGASEAGTPPSGPDKASTAPHSNSAGESPTGPDKPSGPPTGSDQPGSTPAGPDNAAAPSGASATPDQPTTKSAGEDPQGTTGRSRRRRKKIPTDRPPGAPPDPWTAFASESERPPGRLRRGLRASGRALIHEYALVTYAGLLLAVVLTWPTLRYPMHTVPQDVWDPARQAWQIAWAGHVLLDDPAQLWQANAFFPERYSFAFGNSLLGYAPAGMLGDGPYAAVLRYNILFVLAHALLFIGGYALVRQLGAGRTGAAVAAVAFACAPWRLAQEGHLDIVSAGGIPLALAMLARGHGWSIRHGLRTRRRQAGWAAAGWLVVAWQITLGFSLGLPFAYVLAGILLVMLVAVPIRRWRKKADRPVLGWGLIITDLLGALIVAGVGALIALPYLRAPDNADAVAEIRFFSPPVQGLLIAPAESRIWGSPHAVPRSSLGWPAEMALLPGFVLYALALVGLVFSIWKWWQRLLLLLGAVAAGILTLGTTFFGGRWTYLPLFGHLPQSFGVRIPGRLMLWVTLLLAILAAGAVAEVVRRAEHWSAQRIPPWPSPWLRLATFVPLLLVLVEGWNATAHPIVPRQPVAMRAVSGPMLVLPTSALQDQSVMLWSTNKFPQLANGGGGFAAARQAELRQNVAAFPDVTSIQYLRNLGVANVLLLRSQAVGTPWERAGDVPVDALGIRREDLDDAVVFRLN